MPTAEAGGPAPRPAPFRTAKSTLEDIAPQYDEREHRFRALPLRVKTNNPA
jgi:hypothetical protein